MDMKTMLDQETKNEIEALENIEVGSEAYKVAVDGVTKLADRSLAIAQYEADTELKHKEIVNARIDMALKYGLSAVSVVGGFALTVWGTKTSIRFEELGTLTTTAGKEFFRMMFKPRK